MATNEHVEKQVNAVADNVKTWAECSDKKKLDYLYQIRNAGEKMIPEWGKAATEVRGYASYPHLDKAAYMTGPVLFGLFLSGVIKTYESLVKTGKPPKAPKTRKVGNQNLVTVFPITMKDSLFLPIEAELWLEPGKPTTQGKCRKQTGVVGILSAGNFEAPTDILTKMFVETQVVVYARHNNLAKSNCYIEKIMGCLVKDGFLSIVEPGIPNASALCTHPKVDSLMMTGGNATYDKIVWGSEEAKERGEKRVTKPFDAELGAVSPYIIVPSDSYSNTDLETQAGALAGFKLMNSSAICASPQLLVVGKHWKKREAFMEKLISKFEKANPVPVFYTGTEDRVAAASAAYEGRVHEVKTKGGMQPIIIRSLTEADVPSYSLQNEAFAPVLVELVIDAANEKEFVEKAVSIVNSNNVFGSLSCSVVVHPAAEKAMGGKAGIDELAQKLEWGTIAVNNWGAMGTYMSGGVWGAFPKHSPEDIQSGMGFVGNVMMYDYPQKQVLRSPWNHMTLPKGGPTSASSGLFGSMSYYAIHPGMCRLTSLGCALVKDRACG